MLNKPNDDSIYFYNPDFSLTVVAAALYVVPTCILLYQTGFRHKTWYLICIPIAGVLEVAGYISRSVSVKNVSDVVRLLPLPSLPRGCRNFR
jgi:hypothetical protein